MNLRFVLPLLLPTFVTAALPALDCINGAGELTKGFAVENGACVDAASSIFFYAIRSGPISSNGLQAGAATDLHLWFGSQGNPTEAAFDPNNFGLSIPGGGGRLVVDLSPHFIYNTEASLQPAPNSRVELGLGQGNALLGDPCNRPSPFDEVVCAGWTASFGSSTSQIIYEPQDPSGLIGDRGTQVGVKFAHIHPNVSDKIPIYYNAAGVCSNDAFIFCRENAECGSGTCDKTALTASITATVFDGANNILHKATQEVTFDELPAYHIFATNFGLFLYKELAEVVDFQHVAPGMECENVALVDGLFSANVPYAPRFVIFGPQPSDKNFPHPQVSDITIEPLTETTAILKSADNELATIMLRVPPGVEDAKIMDQSPNLGLVSQGPGIIGGTIFAVPVQVGTSPGTYTVEIFMEGERVAVSNLVVDQPATCSDCAAVCGKNRVYTCRKTKAGYRTKCITKATLRKRCSQTNDDYCGRCV